MKKIIKNARDMIKAESYVVSLLFHSHLALSLLYCLITCAIAAIPLINVWLYKLIVDQLTKIYNDNIINQRIWVLLGVYLLLNVSLSLLANMKSFVSDNLYNKSVLDLDKLIMDRIVSLDEEFFDSPDNANALSIAQQSKEIICRDITWVFDIIFRIIALVSGLAIFMSYNVLYGILFILTYLPGVYITFKNRKKMDLFSIDKTPLNRAKNYYKSLLTQGFAAKDLRLYNLADYFKDKYDKLWKGMHKERSELYRKNALQFILSSLITYAGIVTITVLSVHSVMAGTMTIGTFVLYIGLSQTTGENFKGTLINLSTQADIIVPRIIKFLDFVGYENKVKGSGTGIIPAHPEIEFRNVYFKYPNSEKYIIENLSFKIAGGKKVALVGVNGAGKSTIIKLLLRFYKPESGMILIAGKDIDSYLLTELHRLFSVCFQDINKYSLTFKENIAISDIDRINEIKAVKEAAKAAGADKICNDLPLGQDTDLTRQFNNEGVVLSEGQWQKVAIARAFYRNSNFIILDEPSSALDPEAEDYFFSSFKYLCKDKGGILVSHRLSSVMMVDEIILVDKGKFVESGTHKELIEKDGEYAKLYRLQASKYRGDESNVQN